MTKGWKLETLTELQKGDLITLCQNRVRASEDYYRPRLDAMIRFWKIYLSIKDAVDDEDETNTGANYAFGVVEDVTAAISESMLNARVPTPAKARRVQDEKKAENLNAMASTYFSTGQYQSEYPQSVRERVICGSNWEADVWACQYRKSRRYAKQEIIDEHGVPTGQMEVAEIEYDEPVKVGYHTRFPSIFLMRPQPYMDSVDKMAWLVEIEERVALADMKSHMYTDPDSGEKRPFFDVSQIEADKQNGVRVTPSDIASKDSDHQAQYRALVDGVSQKDEDRDDVDQLTLKWVWEVDRVFCVANDKYVVAYVEKLFHKDGIPFRVKSCTPRKQSLYGMGFIEPVEDLLYELDDIHILSMRNWVRIVNKMVAYNPETVKAQDFNDPRAGGKVRVVTSMGQSIDSQIKDLSMMNVTQEMLAAESNNKGLVERSLGMPDFAQGVEGTKQSHDTLGGIQEIKAQSAKRVAAVRRQELAGYQRQMWRMEAMFSQFLVDKTPFTYHGPDGATATMELDWTDIDTEGKGFDFPIVYDPAMGDDALMRNQQMLLQDQAVKYNDAVLRFFPDGSKPLADLSLIFTNMLKPFGYADTSKVLVSPDGRMSPEQKLQAMLRGEPVQISPSEDLVAAYAFFVGLIKSGKLRQGVEAGQAPQDIELRVKSHAEALGAAIQQALVNPEMLLRAKMFAAQPGGGPAGAGGPGGPARPNPNEGISTMRPRAPGTARPS